MNLPLIVCIIFSRLEKGFVKFDLRKMTYIEEHRERQFKYKRKKHINS